MAGVSASGPSEVDPPLAVGESLGPFRLLEIVGKGGMGVVYRAHDARLHRDVAVKVLPRDVEPGAPRHEHLLEEARAAAALSHPNVASVYEAGEHDGRAYFAMELLRGTSLRARLSDKKDPRRVRRGWAMSIARALGSMHVRGWLHLDLKPENVMIAESGEIKLLDFGLSRKTGASGARVRGGTPAYMAPEQAEGLALDARADVYAFGGLLRELLPEERAIARRCLADDRELRFATANEVLAALQRGPYRRAGAVAGVLTFTVAAAAVGFAARETSRKVPTFLPALRLTGNGVDRPISAAAISADGKRVAYVDDDGLLLGDVSGARARVPFDELVVYVAPMPGGGDFSALSHGHDPHVLSLWRLGDKRLLYRGQSKFLAPHPDGETVVSVEDGHIAVRRGQDVRWSLPVPAQRHVCAAKFSVDGRSLAVGYSESAPGGRERAIEIWDVARHALVSSIRTPRLAQGYVPVVFEWAPDGALLYAMSDPPGQGSGTAIWRHTPEAEPRALVSFESQSLAGISVADDGSLLTLRNDIRAKVMASDDFRRWQTLTTEEFDERSVSFAGADTLWQMNYREFVPHLAKRNLLTGTMEPVSARGWAQTWPTVAGEGILYFAAEGTPFEERPTWNLWFDGRDGQSRVQTPALPSEPLAAVATPPVNAQVRCASDACWLASLRGGEVSLFRLSLTGAAPQFLFRLPGDEPFFQAWQVTANGTQMVAARADGSLERYDASGTRLEKRMLSDVVYVRSLALAGDTIYAAVLVHAVPEQRLWRITPSGQEELLAHPAMAYGDLTTSADGRRLAMVARSLDTDVWLTPVRP